MVGGIKAISPCVKSASAKLFLDLHTMSAPSGEERTLGAAAQVERAARCCRCFDSGTQTRCGSATVMVLVSSASGPRVSGCIGARRYTFIRTLHLGCGLFLLQNTLPAL